MANNNILQEINNQKFKQQCSKCFEALKKQLQQSTSIDFSALYPLNDYLQDKSSSSSEMNEVASLFFCAMLENRLFYNNKNQNLLNKFISPIKKDDFILKIIKSQHSINKIFNFNNVTMSGFWNEFFVDNDFLKEIINNREKEVLLTLAGFLDSTTQKTQLQEKYQLAMSCINLSIIPDKIIFSTLKSAKNRTFLQYFLPFLIQKQGLDIDLVKETLKKNKKIYHTDIEDELLLLENYKNLSTSIKEAPEKKKIKI